MLCVLHICTRSLIWSQLRNATLYRGLSIIMQQRSHCINIQLLHYFSCLELAYHVLLCYINFLSALNLITPCIISDQNYKGWCIYFSDIEGTWRPFCRQFFCSFKIHEVENCTMEQQQRNTGVSLFVHHIYNIVLDTQGEVHVCVVISVDIS